MRNRVIYLILSFLLLFSVTGCSVRGDRETAGDPAAGETEAEKTGEDTDEKEDTVIEAPEDMKGSISEFNKNLYEKYADEGNLFYSPFSLVSAAALTCLAAKGETRTGIDRAFSIGDYDRFIKELKDFNGREQSEGAYLKNANGLFIDKSLKLSPGYEENFKVPAEEFFNGEFRSVDYKDQEAVKKDIKEWVSTATEGMIPDYSPGIDESTVADILNAVYFYGEWEKKFTFSDTRPRIFHGLKEDKETEMMNMDDVSFRFLSDEAGIKAIALPYRDSTYEMDIFMYADPSKKDVSGLLDEVVSAGLTEKLDSVQETELGKLTLPKFRMDLELDGLKDRLISMGMENAFSDRADFSLLAENLKISDICHRAVIEVDEEGSRAAAVTDIMMNLTSVPVMEEKEEFIADHPFLFLIRDRESGVVLFTGRLSDPV